MPLGFDILHEDEACLVISKPGGLLTQAPLGIDSLEVRIKKFLRERDQMERDVYLGVPHRLDRPVSGVIVFAKHRKAARTISNQFEKRRVEKIYWALAQGDVQPESATWTDYLKKVEGDPRSVVTTEGNPEGQKAILHYKVMQLVSEPCPSTLLEITLETGRTHQIRIQCASRGYALLGDEMYRSPHHFGPPTDNERERMVALHARSLSFWNPVSRAVMTFVAPLPAYWPKLDVKPPKQSPD